jgi:hypothetical protein
MVNDTCLVALKRKDWSARILDVTEEQHGEDMDMRGL